MNIIIYLMKIIYENQAFYCTYKDKGEHTLISSNSKTDTSLCLYRLDYCTSGILVFAKTEEEYQRLKKMQADNKITKYYTAVTENEFINPLPFAITTYFRPYGEGRKKVKCVTEEERAKLKNKDVTKTPYTTTIIKKDNLTLTCMITKGFRHQIRCHLAFLGSPIKGDTLYNKENVFAEKIKLECVGVNIDGVEVFL